MSDSIAKILWEASEGASRWGVSYEGTRPDLKESVERGARAVALHVLEIACPGSPILSVMRQGASFEEATEREQERRAAIPAGFNPPKIVLGPGGCGEDGCVKPFGHERHCIDSYGVPIVAATVEGVRAREAMSRAAERIDEPTKAELAAAVGEIFAGIAAPMARSGS